MVNIECYKEKYDSFMSNTERKYLVLVFEKDIL